LSYTQKEETKISKAATPPINSLEIVPQGKLIKTMLEHFQKFKPT
jgi:hypothetical protein